MDDTRTKFGEESFRNIVTVQGEVESGESPSPTAGGTVGSLKGAPGKVTKEEVMEEVTRLIKSGEALKCANYSIRRFRHYVPRDAAKDIVQEWYLCMDEHKAQSKADTYESTRSKLSTYVKKDLCNFAWSKTRDIKMSRARLPTATKLGLDPDSQPSTVRDDNDVERREELIRMRHAAIDAINIVHEATTKTKRGAKYQYVVGATAIQLQQILLFSPQTYHENAKDLMIGVAAGKNASEETRQAAAGPLLDRLWGRYNNYIEDLEIPPPQQEIAELVGKSQPTVSRKRKQAWTKFVEEMKTQYAKQEKL